MDGMATSAPALIEIAATGVRFEGDRMFVEFDDGRTVGLPLEWYPRLLESTEEERNNWELIGDGEGIHWPDPDEDLSAEQLALGIRAPVGGIWPGLPHKRDRAA